MLIEMKNHWFLLSHNEKICTDLVVGKSSFGCPSTVLDPDIKERNPFMTYFTCLTSGSEGAAHSSVTECLTSLVRDTASLQLVFGPTATLASHQQSTID